jgi:hypothetical protein
MMEQHTRGLAETKDDDLHGDEELQACSASVLVRRSWRGEWRRGRRESV